MYVYNKTEAIFKISHKKYAEGSYKIFIYFKYIYTCTSVLSTHAICTELKRIMSQF